MWAVCGLLAGPFMEFAVADDWLRNRVRSERDFSTPTPLTLSGLFDGWDREQDTLVNFSRSPESSEDARSTRQTGRQRLTVVRAQNLDFRGLPDVFDGVAPASNRLDNPANGTGGILTRFFDFDAPEGLETPNIEDPGPDSADFPDSAFTVKPGVVFIETSLTTASSKGPRVHDYFTNTLIRVGLKKDWELRISSPGVIQEVGPGIDTTGVGAVTFGFKRHVWDEDKDGWLPAFGIIAQVKTPTGSNAFDNNAAEPTIFFNFDRSLPFEFDFEVNGGVSWLKADRGDRFVQGSILWALGHEIAPHVEGFFHGFTNFPSEPGQNAEVVLGPGIMWAVSPRAMLDFSYNYGLTNPSPHRLIRFGLSLAF